jgi:hypothetical protein
MKIDRRDQSIWPRDKSNTRTVEASMDGGA